MRIRPFRIHRFINLFKNAIYKAQVERFGLYCLDIIVPENWFPFKNQSLTVPTVMRKYLIFRNLPFKFLEIRRDILTLKRDDDLSVSPYASVQVAVLDGLSDEGRI